MRNYHIWTIGCQMNKADSERLENALGQMGLSSAPTLKDADLIVLNSCVVRKSAEDRVVGTLTSLKPHKLENPNKVVALMGCMVGQNPDALQAQFPYVDVFMPPQEYGPLLDLIGERIGIDPEGCLGQLTAIPSVSTYVPIIKGCDKFCSFCIIPYRRGREISRPINEIANEVEHLVHRGVKEVTLLGQNVDSYGHDLAGQPDLADLLARINGVAELARVRFLTSHPNDMSEHIIDSVAGLDKVCEHINLPFQAGDDQVLERMRRGYSNDDYRRKVDDIRKRIPGVSLSTDVIVGFCGETERQFQRTYDLVRDIRFNKVHVAVYSNREGTIADRKLVDDVPDEEKRSRMVAIESLQESIQAELNERRLGDTVEVLIEGVKKGRPYGRNRNDRLVFLSEGNANLGELIDVRIDATGPWSVHGRLVPSVAKMTWR